MRTVKDIGHGGVLIAEHVAKVAMHSLHFRTIVQTQIDPALVGDHHHDPTGTHGRCDGLGHVRQYFEIREPDRMRTAFAIDHSITIQEEALLLHRPSDAPMARKLKKSAGCSARRKTTPNTAP